MHYYQHHKPLCFLCATGRSSQNARTLCHLIREFAILTTVKSLIPLCLLSTRLSSTYTFVLTQNQSAWNPFIFLAHGARVTSYHCSKLFTVLSIVLIKNVFRPETVKNSVGLTPPVLSPTHTSCAALSLRICVKHLHLLLSQLETSNNMAFFGRFR